MDTNDQFILRLKRDSIPDKIIRMALDGTTDKDILATCGTHKWVTNFLWLSKWFDNLSVVRSGRFGYRIRAAYANVVSVVPTPISSSRTDTIPQLPSAVVSDQPEVTDIRWPSTPPIIESMGDMYREPSWFQVMDKMVKAGRHISLAGAPGVGKDTGVQELAARNGKVLVTVGGDAGFRKRDLVGQMQISNGKSFLEVAEYAAAVVNGWWALISEVNAADADAIMFLNGQLAAPKTIVIGGRAYPVHPDFRLFISYNPGLVGTKPIPQSFKDRFFSIQIPWFRADQLKRLLTAHGAPEQPWLEYIVKYGLLLWDTSVRGSIRYQVTPRRLMDAVTLMVEGVCSDWKEAVKMGVVASIDSPVEAQVATQLINNIVVI